MLITLNNRKHLRIWWPIILIILAITLVLTFYNAVMHNWLGTWFLTLLGLILFVSASLLGFVLFLSYLEAKEEDEHYN